MKIAIFSNTCYETIVPVVNELEIIGHSVDFYALTSNKGSGKAVLFETNKLWENEKQGNIIPDINIKKYISECWNPYLKRGKWFSLYFHNFAFFKPNNWNLILAIIKKIRKEKYDILHFNAESLLFNILALIFNKKKIVFEIHDVNPHTGENHFIAKLIRQSFKLLRTTNFIVHSNFSKKELLEKYSYLNPNQVHYIPFGSHEWLKTDSKTLELNNSLLFFGRISPYKGIEILCEAVRDLCEEIHNIKLTVAGNGKMYFDYKNYESDNISFINRYISNKELSELVYSHQIIVCPYIDATQSGVIQSALTLNKWIIATNVGAIPEMIETGKNGMLISPNNISELKQAIKESLYQEKYKFYKPVIQKSWKEITALLIRIYE
ncbi:MAG: glycosyltransferase family 4 protein [Bacteroidales bacterium]